MVAHGDQGSVTVAREQAVAAGPYLFGGCFTAADVYTGSQIAWGLMFGTLPGRPALRDDGSRIENRPAPVRARLEG